MTDIIVARGQGAGGSEEEVLRLAASVESGSGTPTCYRNCKWGTGQEDKNWGAQRFYGYCRPWCKGKIDGMSVLVGNQKLMKDSGIDSSAVISDLHRLEDEAKTAMLVAVDGKIAGIISVADTLKEDSVKAIEELKKWDC